MNNERTHNSVSCVGKKRKNSKSHANERQWRADWRGRPDRRERPCDARGGNEQAKSSRRPSRSRSRSRRRRAYTVYRRVGRATAQRAPHTHTNLHFTHALRIGYYGLPPPVNAHTKDDRNVRPSYIKCARALTTTTLYVSRFHAKRRT